MLSKLMKYDLRSMFKVFIPLWAALLVVSLVNRFTMQMQSYDAPQVISMLLYVFLFAAVIIVAIVLIIMRFYNGLLKDEGYLMFTLPVKPWQLVVSKCLTAAIIILLSLIVGAGSICLIALDSYNLMDIGHFFDRVGLYWTADLTLTVILSVILLFTAICASITHVYASLAIGHLAPSHRIGWAVAAYIGINILFTTIGMIIGRLTHGVHFEIHVNEFQAVNLSLGMLIALCVIQIAIFYVATERILSKRLNLE